MRPNTVIVLAAITFGLCIGTPASANDQGAAVFSQKCTSCHTVGGGNLVGPDLSKVAGWPEADLSSSVKRMEKMVGPLSDAQVNDIVSFLKQADAAKRLQEKQEEVKAQAAFEQDKNPASAENGKLLFFGKQPFQNGGMSCVSCHRAGESGGALGPDLSDVAQRMSETALISACENTNFKVMKAAYAKHPVTHQEARELTKFFQATKPTEPRKKLEPTWLAGSGVAAAALAAIGIGFRNRNSQVRKKIRRR